MLNAKAYALSVRDSTEFRVEQGNGFESNGYSIAKVTIEKPAGSDDCNAYGPFLLHDDSQDSLSVEYIISQESTVLDVVVLGEDIPSDIPSEIRFSFEIDHCSGFAIATNTNAALVGGDATITLSGESPK